MLSLLSYVLALLTAVALIACVASGLLFVCDWIENHYARSRLVGTRLTLAMTLLTLLVSVTDELPFAFLASNIASQSLLYLSFGEGQPFSSTAIRLALQVLLPLLPHLALLHRFHPSTHDALLDRKMASNNQSRDRLPGGRLDWDAYSATDVHLRIYTGGQQLCCFALCWLPSLWAVLLAIASNASLPFTTERRGKLTRSQ